VPRLQRGVVAGAGHFMHIEQPERTAALVLDFLEP
jgi:pimeloyl-ACP methyl ester carboxylesterase